MVEDSRPDVNLIRMALSHAKIDADIVVLDDGEKAVRFFQEVQTSAACPDLVLLDINLPRFRGKDVLSRIRTGACEHVPVLVVTSSNSPADREEMEKHGAEGYFRKPSNFTDFMKLGLLVRELLLRK